MRRPVFAQLKPLIGSLYIPNYAERRDSGADVARAYAPYLMIIALFSIANIGPVKDALARSPWTIRFAWPGLDLVTAAGKPVSSVTFAFGWLSAAGTLLVIAGILTALVLRVPAGTALRAYADTYVALRHAIVTVMAVLALAYVLNQSGQTGTLGALLAGTGGAFVFLSSILGWIGVAVTGSATSRSGPSSMPHTGTPDAAAVGAAQSRVPAR